MNLVRLSALCSGRPRLRSEFDDRATVLCGFKAGIENRLGLERRLGPEGIRGSSQGEITEIAEELGFLGRRVFTPGLRNELASEMLLHRELAALNHELGIVDMKVEFPIRVGKHKVIEADIPLVPADMQPLLMIGQEGIIEGG